MELIENESEERGALAEPEPRYHTAVLPTQKTENGESPIRILAAILIGVVLVILLVLFARWVYHKVHHADQTAVGTSQQTTATSENNSSSTAQPTNPSNSNSTSSNPTPANNSTTGKTNANLPNSGPGDVAKIFAATAFAAASLHYIISIRKLNRT